MYYDIRRAMSDDLKTSQCYLPKVRAVISSNHLNNQDEGREAIRLTTTTIRATTKNQVISFENYSIAS